MTERFKMKLFKKLMPLVTVVSTASVVTPLVTSCSAGIASTNKFDYTPSAKHAKETIKITDHSALKTLATDYFSDPQHLAQDWLYAKAQTYTQLRDYLTSIYDDVEVSFNVKVDNISYETKTLNLTMPWETTSADVTAALINAQITYSRKYTFTLNNLPEEDKNFMKKYKFILETQETDTVKNVFAFVHYVPLEAKYIPTIYFWLDSKESENWEWRDSECYKARCEYTYIDDTVIVDENHDDSNDYYSAKTGVTAEDLFNWGITDENGFMNATADIQYAIGYDIFQPVYYVGSYYLSDITFTK